MKASFGLPKTQVRNLICLLSLFFLSYFVAKNTPYSARLGYVMSGSMSE